MRKEKLGFGKYKDFSWENIPLNYLLDLLHSVEKQDKVQQELESRIKEAHDLVVITRHASERFLKFYSSIDRFIEKRGVRVFDFLALICLDCYKNPNSIVDSSPDAFLFQFNLDVKKARILFICKKKKYDNRNLILTTVLPPKNSLRRLGENRKRKGGKV